MESLMVLQHDSYEGSNDPPPHQLEAETVLLAHAEVSDEGSEAMGDSDGEAKSDSATSKKCLDSLDELDLHSLARHGWAVSSMWENQVHLDL